MMNTQFVHQWLYVWPPHGGPFMFCWIQKVGCTNFKALINPQSANATYLRKILGHHRSDLYAEYDRMIRNASIFKAVFYRDPLERFLSGYLDKCAKRSRVYCITVFGKEDATFEEAVHILNDKRDPVHLDGHFHHQRDFCGGLEEYLPHFDFVEQLRRDTPRQKVDEMLCRANVSSNRFDELYPPAQGGEGRRQEHATHAYERLVQYYDRPELVGIVVDYYYDDYFTFGIALSDFAVAALLQLNATDNHRHKLNQSRLESLLALTTPSRAGLGISRAKDKRQIKTSTKETMSPPPASQDIQNGAFPVNGSELLTRVVLGLLVFGWSVLCIGSGSSYRARLRRWLSSSRRRKTSID